MYKYASWMDGQIWTAFKSTALQFQEIKKILKRKPIFYFTPWHVSTIIPWIRNLYDKTVLNKQFRGFFN